MPGTVVKGVVGAGLRAAWRRDGMTRDETTWAWWTLPPPISGCLARRYHRHPPLSSRPCWTSRNARSRSGLRRPAGCLLAASGHQGARGPALLQLINGVADRAVPMRRRTRPAHCAVWSACLQPARAAAVLYLQRRVCIYRGEAGLQGCATQIEVFGAAPVYRPDHWVSRWRRDAGTTVGEIDSDQAVSWFAGLSGIHSIRTVVASSERRPCWWSRMAWLRRRRVSGAGVPLAL